MTDPGIVCPLCGASMNKVVNTRKRNGFVYRRRACLDCGARVSTRELSAYGALASPLQSQTFIRAMHDRIDHVLS